MNWTRLGAIVLAAAGSTSVAHAALQASATLQLGSVGGTVASPTYTYDMVLNDTGTTPVGTFWYAWVPGEDFLATSPTVVNSPAGWTEVITHFPNTPGNGYAIQWVASTSAADVTAGGTLGGFQFTSADNPASVSGNSLYYPTTPVGTSFVYSGAPFSDGGFQFQVTTVPEPLLLSALPALLLLRQRRTA